MKMLDLFSGIGGFSLAAHSTGQIKTIGFSEIEPYAIKVLEKNFKGIKNYGDITKIKGEEILREHGTVDIICGGFPCQPFSHAGQRKGKDDERAFFPEILRLIRELRPSYFIGENVGGLVSIHDGEYYEEIASSLESENYEVQAFIIPASAVNAPHRRDRIWIIAHSRCPYGQGRQGKRESDRALSSKETAPLSERPAGDDKSRTAADPVEKGLQGRSEKMREQRQKPYDKQYVRCSRYWDENWFEVATELCRVDDGVSEELYKLENSDRIHRLKCLGNSIVPQIAELIFRAILEVES